MSAPAHLGGLARAAGLELLVLFGSRARGDERPQSDWDLAYLAPRPLSRSQGAVDANGLLADLVLALGNDRIDLVDLRTASGLLRHAVASQGQLVYEGRPGAFQEFQIEAARFWCDVRPIMEASYAAVLDGLARP